MGSERDIAPGSLPVIVLAIGHDIGEYPPPSHIARSWITEVLFVGGAVESRSIAVHDLEHAVDPLLAGIYPL